MTKDYNEPDPENLPDDDENSEDDGHLIEEHLEGQDGSGKRRRRKKIKIRKRVRIKRKSSPKKKARKMMSTFAWVLIIAAFIICLVIMVLQMDFSSKHKKNRSEIVPTEQIKTLT